LLLYDFFGDYFLLRGPNHQCQQSVGKMSPKGAAMKAQALQVKIEWKHDVQFPEDFI